MPEILGQVQFYRVWLGLLHVVLYSVREVTLHFGSIESSCVFEGPTGYGPQVVLILEEFGTHNGGELAVFVSI